MTTTPTDTKPWYLSSTILGAIATGIIAICAAFKVDLTGCEADINQALLGLVAIVTTIITIIGRVTASKEITAK